MFWISDISLYFIYQWEHQIVTSVNSDFLASKHILAQIDVQVMKYPWGQDCNIWDCVLPGAIEQLLVRILEYNGNGDDLHMCTW